MNFERLLLKAKEGNADAVLKILECDCEWQI